MNKVEIDGDTADRIVICSLKESMQYLKSDTIGFQVIGLRFIHGNQDKRSSGL